MAKLAYSYPVPRIKSRETRLLDSSMLNRILAEEKPENAMRILAETEYSHHLAEIDSVYQFENLLNRELQRVYSLLFELAPDERLLHLITMRGDVQNLKVLFKSDGKVKADSSLFTTRCEVQPKKLLQIYEEKRWDKLPEHLEQAVLSLQSEFEENGFNQQLIDVIFDRYHYLRAGEIVKKLKSKLLIKFYKQKIDFLNIEIFIRAREMDRDLDFLKKALLDSGNIEKKLLYELFEEDLSALVARFKMSDYHRVIQEGIEAWNKDKSLRRFETLADDYLMETIKKAKFIFFGPEPLFGYLWAKETEIKNLRIILTGKINNLPDSAIKERLNELYI
ncbi:MAG: V-type ATP synthase subunit C [bacterium]